MRESESFARRCFEAYRAPLRLRPVERQSDGEHDFDIIDASGDCVGAVEVTMAASQEYVRTMSAVFDARRGSGVADRRVCSACWAVTVGSGVRMNDVRSRLDDYLYAIEQADIAEFDCTTKHPAVVAIRRDLKIHSGRHHTHDINARHFVAPPPLTAWTDAFAVNKAVEVEAAKPDNLRKLSRVEHQERHLFVFVDMSSLGAYVALEHNAASPEPPQVPSTITHVWAGAPQQGHVGVFWCASNGGPWARGEVSLIGWPDVELVT